MHDLTDDERKQALGEVLFDELRAIREILADVPKRTEFNALRDKVDKIADDLEAIKLVVKDRSAHLRRHGQEIAAFKAA